MVFRRRSESPFSSRTLVGEMLEPVLEGPSPSHQQSRKRDVKEWMKEQIEKTSHLLHLGQGGGSSSRKFRAKQLLASLGVSLGPFPVGKLPPTVCPKDSPIETSSAQYIVQQYIAATGGSKLHSSIKNTYATGRFKMHLTDFETPGTSTGTVPHSPGMSSTTTSSSSMTLKPRECSDSGCFVLWQMRPDKWYVEIALRGTKLRAGCDSRIVWRQSPIFSGSTSQVIRGPVRPLRRSLNGLDPTTVASMFLNARCIGEKRVGGEDCFVLKLAADPFTLNATCRAVNGKTAVYRAVAEPPEEPPEEEVIRHVAFGYFSQRSGLLVRMEDSRLTRVTAAVPRGAVTYWEVTVESVYGEYRAAEEGGVVVAHAGSTAVSIFRFGEESMCHSRTRVEETWSIDDVAHNVVGLSAECFMPPADCVAALATSDVDVHDMFLRCEQNDAKQQQQQQLLH